MPQNLNSSLSRHKADADHAHELILQLERDLSEQKQTAADLNAEVRSLRGEVKTLQQELAAKVWQE